MPYIAGSSHLQRIVERLKAMSITKIIQSVEFLVDAEGNKKAAVLDWPVWEALLTMLEALEEDQVVSGEQVQAAVSEQSQNLSLDSLLAGVTEQNLHNEVITGPTSRN